MEWFFGETSVRLKEETLNWVVSYDDGGRELTQAYEQSLASFRSWGPSTARYPFYETDVPLDIVQALCGGDLPDWWKPLSDPVLAVFQAARSPRNATKDLENLFLQEVPIDELDGCGFTPVWYAARFGEPESVLALLGCGAQANRIYPHVYGYETLLHAAVSRGYPDLVSKLLRRGVDPNRLDSLGKPALHYLEEEPALHRRTARPVAQALVEGGAAIGKAPEVLRKRGLTAVAAWLES
ncbi:hypothetical protein ABS71_20770 [bacterium SCN 62-11]|nr:MAG: hypothetical protein ABS71_20770 [bacterium SCN 62-11]